MWKVIVIILIAGALGAFYLLPREEGIRSAYLREHYTNYLEKSNEEAGQKFGPLQKIDSQAQLKNFKLESCKSYKDDYICRAHAQIEIKGNSVEKKLEFYLRRKDSGFDVSIKQL